MPSRTRLSFADPGARSTLEGFTAVRSMRVRQMHADDRSPLLRLWERSVRATHHFLDDGDIVGLRPHVAEALASGAVDWWVLASATDEIIGFLGVAGSTIEALFVDPDRFRQGAGHFLGAHAEGLAATPLAVDVNEQNQSAVRFYEALGFEVVGRSPTDSAGRPFPLLHMRRSTPGA